MKISQGIAGKASVRRLGHQMAVGVLISALLVVAGAPATAWAGTAGGDPSGCGTGATWKYTDFNVGGVTMREELRHAYGCGGVGWGRLTRVTGTGTLDLIQSAWNPGGPSEYGVPGSNWTYTVDANPGLQVCAGFQAYSVDGLGQRHYINWFYAGCYTA
jgi:hypothetical protein